MFLRPVVNVQESLAFHFIDLDLNFLNLNFISDLRQHNMQKCNKNKNITHIFLYFFNKNNCSFVLENSFIYVFCFLRFFVCFDVKFTRLFLIGLLNKFDIQKIQIKIYKMKC